MGRKAFAMVCMIIGPLGLKMIGGEMKFADQSRHKWKRRNRKGPPPEKVKVFYCAGNERLKE